MKKLQASTRFRLSNRRKVEAWCDRVLSGAEPVSRWIVIAVKRYRADKCHWRFSQKKADYAIWFFETQLKHIAGKYAGEPFILTDLQRFILWNLMGYRDNDIEKRRFSKLFLTVARKFGKTSFISGLALLLLYRDFPIEVGGQGLIAATKTEQAQIGHTMACEMAKANQAMSVRCNMFRNRERYSALILPEPPHNGSVFKPVGSDSKTSDGWNPSFVIIDELHAWDVKRHAGLREKLQTAGGARLQPIEMIVSTNGDENSTFYQQEVQNAKNILEAFERGERIGERVFPILALMDEARPCRCGSERGCESCENGIIPADDPFDESNWPKANPSIGVTPTWEFMREQAERAKREPAFKNAFLRYHCNVQVSSRVNLINSSQWAACERLAAPWGEAEAICGGIDLGNRDDLSAWVICGRFRDEDDKPFYQFMANTFVPDGIGRNVHEEPWSSWAEAGWLTITQGTGTDFDAIQDEIVAMAQKYTVGEWRHDRYSAKQMATILTNEHGLTCPEFPQTCPAFNEPLKDFVRAVGAGEVVYPDNEVLTWAASNAVAKTNNRGEIMPDRNRSHEKIDTFVAAVLAYSGVMVGLDTETDKTGTYYESNPLEMV